MTKHELRIGVHITVDTHGSTPYLHSDGIEERSLGMTTVTVTADDVAGITIYLEDEEARTEIALSMAPDEARRLAEAILANAVVTPTLN